MGSIEFDCVTLRRGSKLVFDGLTVSISQSRVGLLGDNGAGKSSLLRLINGLLLPDEGEVRVNGLVTSKARRELPAKVGFVFQNPEHQIVFPTALEEVAFGFREQGAPRAEANEKAREVFTRFGCVDWAEAVVHEMSEGQKQRLCIMSIVAMNPDILVMDEPFASLDLPTRIDLTELIATLPQQLIVASHDLELLAGMDRVIWLSGGKVVGDGPPASVINAYKSAIVAMRKPTVFAS